MNRINKKTILKIILILLVTISFFGGQIVGAVDDPPSGDLIGPSAPPAEEKVASDKKTVEDKAAADKKAAGGTGGTSAEGASSGGSTAEVGLAGQIRNALMEVVTFIPKMLIILFGKLLIILMKVVVWLSLYNRFIDNPYVNEGWVIMRDLVNMFFILGLLFIAFVTVLKIEKYSWNKLLGKLLVMAILVNFSKTITGVIIDFFQVIMITFVASYRDITAGNIFQGLAITDWFNATESISGAEGAEAFASTILALIFSVISCLVIMIFCVILAFRIVALWLLIVFSPLAFFTWVFGDVGGQVGKLGSRWWKEFFNYCLIGPFLAFFLWLSVLTMANLNIDQMVPEEQYSKAERTDQALPSKASSMDNMIGFLMGIIMLVAGLKFSADFAVAGAGWGNKQMSKLGRGTQSLMGRAAKGYYGQKIAPTLRGSAEGIGKRWQTRGGLAGAAGQLAKMPTAALRKAGKGLERAGTRGRSDGTQEKGVLAGIGKAMRKTGEAPGELGTKAKEAWQKKEAEGGVIGKSMEYSRKGAKGGVAVAAAPFKIPLTAKQREFEREQTRTAMSGYVSGDFKERRAAEAKRSDEIFAMEGIDPQNMDKVKSYVDDVKDGKRNYNPQMMEGAVRALAKGGKLTEPEYLNDIKDKFGFMQDRDPLEQILLDEELENSVQEKTGYRPSFSNYIYNPATNEVEDITALENGKKSAVANLAADSGLSQDVINEELDNIDMTKLMKTNEDGTFEIDTKSKEFTSATGDKKSVIAAIALSEGKYKTYKSEVGVDDPERFEHDFHRISRSTEIKNKRSTERIQGIQTANMQQSKNFHNTTSAMSAGEHGEDIAFDQLTGAVRNVKNVSGLEEKGLKNGNTKARFMLGDNDERLAVLKDNKGSFKGEIKQIEDANGGKSIDDITADELGNATIVQKLDKKKSNMTLDDMEKSQKYIEATSATYDVDGRREDDGEISESLKLEINKRRESEGVTGKLNENLTDVRPTVVDVIDNRGADMLKATKGMDKETRKDAIQTEVQNILDNEGSSADSGEITDNIMKLEKDFEKRSKDGASLRSNLTPDYDAVIQGMNSAVASGDPSRVDQGEINFQIKILTDKYNEQIKSSGLRDKDFKIEDIKIKLENMRDKMENVMESQSDYDAQSVTLRKSIEATTDENMKKKIRAQLKDVEGNNRTVQNQWRRYQDEIKNIIKGEVKKQTRKK